MPSFSASDLRARVHSGFSAFELRKLLSSWGATPEETEGDSTALAHRVVRLGYKRFGLGELVHKLRAEKPLLEWPDPGSEPDERWAGPPSLTGAAAAGFTATPAPPEVAADVTVQMSERTLAETLGAAPIPAAEPAPPTVAPTLSMEAVSPWTEGPWSARGPRASAPPPSSRSQEGPPSRGLVFAEPEYFRRANAPSKPPSRAPLFIAIGAAVVAVAGVAFGAGWLIQARRGEGSAPAASAATGAPVEPRGHGPAGRAADLFDDGLRRVAETCGLDVTGTPTPEVFALAQEACGRDETLRMERAEAKRRRAGRDALDSPALDPPPRRFPQDDPPLPARQPTPPRLPAHDADFRAAPPPAPKQAPAPSCSAKCSAARDECSAGCGAEPNDASLYGAYQSCTSRCMTQETRCRRNCF